MKINKEKFTTIEQKLHKMREIKPERAFVQETRSLLLDGQSLNRRHLGPLKSAVFSLASLSTILVFTGFASASSLPGEALYPIKRSIEKIQLAFTNKDSQIVLRDNITEKRIDELKKLAEKSNENSKVAISEVSTSINEIKQQMSKMRTENENVTQTKNSFQELVPKIEEKQATLAQIEAVISVENKPEVVRIIKELEEIKQTIESVTKEPEIEEFQDKQRENLVPLPTNP